jgi:hypothetical protein
MTVEFDDPYPLTDLDYDPVGSETCPIVSGSALTPANLLQHSPGWTPPTRPTPPDWTAVFVMIANQDGCQLRRGSDWADNYQCGAFARDAVDCITRLGNRSAWHIRVEQWCFDQNYAPDRLHSHSTVAVRLFDSAANEWMFALLEPQQLKPAGSNTYVRCLWRQAANQGLPRVPTRCWDTACGDSEHKGRPDRGAPFIRN